MGCHLHDEPDVYFQMSGNLRKKAQGYLLVVSTDECSPDERTTDRQKAITWKELPQSYRTAHQHEGKCWRGSSCLQYTKLLKNRRQGEKNPLHTLVLKTVVGLPHTHHMNVALRDLKERLMWGLTSLSSKSLQDGSLALLWVEHCLINHTSCANRQVLLVWWDFRLKSGVEDCVWTYSTETRTLCKGPCPAVWAWLRVRPKQAHFCKDWKKVLYLAIRLN